MTAPAVSPITLAELKAHLRITTTAEDTYLTRCLSMGVARAEAYLGVAMVNRTIDLFLDQVREAQVGLSLDAETLSSIALPKAPLASVTGLYTYDTADVETAWTTTSYVISGAGDPMNRGALSLVRGWTWPAGLRIAKAVRVRYVAGFGAAAVNVPEDYQQACLVMASAFYGHRGDCAATTPPTVEATLAQFDHMRAIWL